MHKPAILPLILFVLTLATTSVLAQDKSPDYLIESVDLKELKTYKWKQVTKYFKDFDKKQKVTIRVTYTDPLADTERKGKIDNFDISVSGEAREAKELTQKMENILATLTSKF